MRKFYVENEAGERFSLWGNRVYMTEPSGLGIKNELSYVRAGNYFLRNKKQASQAEVAGSIQFMDPGANDRLRKFYDFCAAAEELYLIYDPGDGTEYVRDIDISEVGKSERTGGTLPILVKFICKSLYYLKDNNRFVFEPPENEKRYDYSYDYNYEEYGTYEADLYNNGHVPAPFECMIYGFCMNPMIRVEKDGEKLYEVVFPVEVKENEYIKYSSRDGMLEAVLVSGDSEKNLMNQLDITKDNFFKIPVGKNKIIFTSSNETTNRIFVTLFKMYEVV